METQKKPIEETRRIGAIAMYQAGATLQEVADTFGVATTTAWKWLRVAGVACRPSGAVQKLTDEQQAEVYRRFKAGESRADLAREHHLSWPTLDRLVKAWRRREETQMAGCV